MFSEAFRRAVRRSFSLVPFLFMAITLIVCGVFVVFFRAVPLWGAGLVPLFLMSGLVLGAGAVVIRHERGTSFWKTFLRSGDVLLTTTYLGLPLLFAYLIIWVLIGLLVLLKEIPLIGTFFGIVLSFAPFLLVFGILALLITTLLALFFAAPPLAHTSSRSLREIAPQVLAPLRRDLFRALVGWLIALAPVIVLTWILLLTHSMTEALYSVGEESFESVLQNFFLMLPFAVLLAPAALLYFNFAAEVSALLPPAKSQPE